MPGSSEPAILHVILQARILEWVAMPSSKGSSRPGDQTHISSPALAGGLFTTHLCHLGSLQHTLALDNMTIVTLSIARYIEIMKELKE